MAEVRVAIEEGRYKEFKEEKLTAWNEKARA